MIDTLVAAGRAAGVDSLVLVEPRRGKRLDGQTLVAANESRFPPASLPKKPAVLLDAAVGTAFLRCPLQERLYRHAIDVPIPAVSHVLLHDASFGLAGVSRRDDDASAMSI